MRESTSRETLHLFIRIVSVEKGKNKMRTSNRRGGNRASSDGRERGAA